MVGKHNEVVAAAGADGEYTHVIGVDLVSEVYPDM